jgi:anti-anti-sigma regulatory factor
MIHDKAVAWHQERHEQTKGGRISHLGILGLSDVRRYDECALSVLHCFLEISFLTRVQFFFSLFTNVVV